MSVQIPTLCVWPELQQGSESSGSVGLPLPFRNYGADPRNATLSGDLSSPKPARRSRFKTSYSQLTLEWRFKQDQYDLFQSFFFETLGNGTAIFRIALRYPENSTLTYWNVRFMDDYRAEWLDGRWAVRAVVDLVQKSYTSDVSSIPGYQDYAALIDSTSAADSDQLYRTRDGQIYNVRV